MRRPSTLLMLILFSALCSLGCNAQPRTWRNTWLTDVTYWPVHMEDARLTADGSGLRVEVADGKTWAIAATDPCSIPKSIRAIRVTVKQLGGGAKWLVRVYGDLNGTGASTTYGPFGGQTEAGPHEINIDPRLLSHLGDRPVQLQLGLEGPAGTYVVFGNLQFVADRATSAHKPIPGQHTISAVELMPNLPQPLNIIDWRQKARAYDRYVFDMRAKGQFLPLTWIDRSHVNGDFDTFGMSSYVGDGRLAGSDQEGVTCIGAVLGASVAGINKAGSPNYVRMCEAFYNRKSGDNLVLNLQNQHAGGSFWYDIYPHIVFYALADRYPHTGQMDQIVQSTAKRWADAVEVMGGAFDHTGFDFTANQPIDNHQWTEPDCAAGIAWLQYAAWQRSRDPRLLKTADTCLKAMSQRKTNPYYEALLPWGTLTAARMNAEQGAHYDVGKMLNWCFGISDCRGGWGVIVNRWGQYDCAGLVGSVDNGGGYAFAMNTFAQAGALAPLPRYNPGYARAIGKWMLNLANSARLFYPGQMPSDHQCCGFWKEDTGACIAYEGLRYRWQGKTPCATGDPVTMKWGPKTDRGLYGSGYVGLLGGIVRNTDVDGILQLDCLATDFYRQRAYPTYLLYNPYGRTRRVRLAVPTKAVDVYDVIAGRYLAKRAVTQAQISVPADTAVLAVCVPAGCALKRDGAKVSANGVVVDYGIR